MPDEKLDAKYPRANFRLGQQLERELTERAEPGRGTDSVAKRDLERYYVLLKLALYKMPPFTEAEAMAMIDALNGLLVRPESVSILWANVEEAIHYEGLDKRYGIDGVVLVNRLREMTPFESMAVADAIERAWKSDTYHIDNMRERAWKVGLVRDPKKSVMRALAEDMPE